MKAILSNRRNRSTRNSLEEEMCRIHGENITFLNTNEKPVSPIKIAKRKPRKASQKLEFKCSECNFKTTGKKIMKKHKAEHKKDESSFECNECGYMTMFKEQFTVHMKIHSTKKLYKCVLCPFNTAHEGYYKAHAVFHLILKPQENKKNCKAKKYACSQCDFSSAKKQLLQKHLNKHDFSVQDEKVYHSKNLFRCPKCIFLSHSSRGIIKHMQVHRVKNTI